MRGSRPLQEKEEGSWPKKPSMKHGKLFRGVGLAPTGAKKEGELRTGNARLCVDCREEEDHEVGRAPKKSRAKIAIAPRESEEIKQEWKNAGAKHTSWPAAGAFKSHTRKKRATTAEKRGGKLMAAIITNRKRLTCKAGTWGKVDPVPGEAGLRKYKRTH